MKGRIASAAWCGESTECVGVEHVENAGHAGVFALSLAGLLGGEVGMVRGIAPELQAQPFPTVVVAVLRQPCGEAFDDVASGVSELLEGGEALRLVLVE